MLVTIMATVPTIRKALPIREIRKQIRRLQYYLDGRVVGTTHDYAEFNLLRMEKGRFLTASDNEKYQNYAVLAAETTEKLFPYENPLNQSVKLGTDYYTVVGVTSKRASSAGIGGSLSAQTCDPHHEELVEHRREDRAEANALEQGQLRVARKRKDPGVVVEERQLAIDQAISRSRRPLLCANGRHARILHPGGRAALRGCHLGSKLVDVQ